jgi:hypothetical protein
MDYNVLSLLELKQQAKGRRIKQYYIMKRTQLIEILSLAELPAAMKIEKMTIIELREKAKERGLHGFWGLSRDRLVELLFPPNEENGKVREAAPNKNQENHGEADKHHEPEEHDTEEIGIEDV